MRLADSCSSSFNDGKNIRWRDGLTALTSLWRLRAWRHNCMLGPPLSSAQTEFVIQRSEMEWGGVRKPSPAAAARGFTLVELLTVISIIGMLMSLMLPAIMQAREAGRRAVCANNLRNVALAMEGFATTRGRLPAAGNFSTSGKEYHSWVVSVLPYVERTDVARGWDYTVPVSNAPNAALAAITVEVLICPDDSSLAPGTGNLSYVVNGGFGWTKPVDCPAIMQSGSGGAPQDIDLNGNGVTCPTTASQDGTPNDRELYYQTGVFFPENWPLGTGTVRHHSLETISDGLSRTIMLAENTWARVAGGEAGWASPLPWGNSFYISGFICKNAKCSSGNVDWTLANSHVKPYASQAINGTGNSAGGPSPWPSSGHPGGVNVIYCDGHLSFLSDQVDGAVYANLVTPQGQRIRGPLAQARLDDEIP